MTTDRKPKLFYGYIVVLTAFLIMMVTWGAFYCFGVFFKPVLVEFGWTRAATSGAYSLSFVLSGFIGIFAGRLSDRLGPRIVVIGCGLFLGSGYLLMSQISIIWQLYLFYGVIVGIGLSGVYVSAVSAVSRWFVKRRGMMTGIVIAGIGAGTMIMPPLANWFISSYGWRASYNIIGIIVLVLMILAAQFLKRDPSQIGLSPYGENEVEQESLNLEARGFSLQRAIHTGQFWMLCVMFLCFGVSVQAIIVHIVIHATELEISAASAANILAVIGGVSITGRIIMGSAGDRIGNKLAITICFILMSVALLWLLATKELWMFYLFAVIFGFAYGGWAALMSLIVAELFGLSSLGVILGAVIFSVTIGEAIGPALAGGIFDITSSYQPAFLICTTLSIITIILVLFLRPITNKGGENDSERSA